MKYVILIIFIITSFKLSALNRDNENINPKASMTFTEIGYDGFEYRPNIVTWQQANNYCDQVVREKPNEDNTIYQRCINSFIPTLPETPTAGNSCDAASVSWSGICKGEIRAGRVGDLFTVNHIRNGDNYTGQAKFNCLNGKWVYDNGTCIDLPENCELNTEITWSVDLPTWAKSGGLKPKSACFGSLDSNVRTGVIDTITADNTGYVNELSKAKRACVDGRLVPLPSEKDTCIYMPKSCDAKTIDYGNCSFNLPRTIHPFNLSDPNSPAVPVAVAYDSSAYHGNYSTACFDGDFLSPNVRTCFQNPVCSNTQGQCQFGSISNFEDKSTSNLTCPDGYVLESGDCNKYTNSRVNGAFINYCDSGFYDVDLGQCVDKKGTILVVSENYSWNCSSGRMAENCNKNIPPYSVVSPDPLPPIAPASPVCSNIENLCDSGNVNSQLETALVWSWKCSNEIENISCSKDKPVIVEPSPVCSSTINVCSAGNFNDLVDSTTHNLWSCSNSTNTINCSVIKPVVAPAAVCSTNLNLCSVGSVNSITTSSTKHLWVCNSGSNDANCSKDRQAVCSNTENLCSLGSVINQSETSSSWLWSCRNGSETSNCSKNKPVIPPAKECRYETNPYNFATYDTLTTLNMFYWNNIQIGAKIGPSGTLHSNGYNYTVGILKLNTFMDGNGFNYYEICREIGTPPVVNLKWKIDCITMNNTVCGTNAETAYNNASRPFGFPNPADDLQGKTCNTEGQSTIVKILYRDGYYSSKEGSSTFKCSN